MSVKEREPEITTPTKPEEKIEKPRRYVVAMESSGMVRCQTCVLIEVFGMSAAKARGHVSEAFMLGSSVVLPPTTRDVAESKADEANALRDKKARICVARMQHTKFTAEPV